MPPDFPPSRYVQVAVLRHLFPAYQFRSVHGHDGYVLEALAKDAGLPVYCLISKDPREIWQELSQIPAAALKLPGALRG